MLIIDMVFWDPVWQGFRFGKHRGKYVKETGKNGSSSEFRKMIGNNYLYLICRL